MAELRDPAIKLFGKTIPLAMEPASSSLSDDEDDDVNRNPDHERSTSPNSDEEGQEQRLADEDFDRNDKEPSGDKPTETKEEDKARPASSGELRNCHATSRISENQKTNLVEKENTSPKASKADEEQSEASQSQEKTLKKPDKIIPCPRCNSMDTKFCYYNNYNVNQPRHFCKKCQRYWTAGGTMRNVPVGAGRRKNKNTVSQYRQISVSEALHNGRTDIPHHPSLTSNGTVLSFGSDVPLCESMVSVLNLAGKTMNGFHKPEELTISLPYQENSDTSAVVSSVTSLSSSKGEGCKSGSHSQEQVMQNCQNFPPPIPMFHGAPWPYPVPVPAFCPPGYPMPFYPAAAYWGCQVPGNWSVPWLPQPTSPSSVGPSSGPNSPTLGKHSRDEGTFKSSSSNEEEQPRESGSERSLWIPKTLRIDDPGEAAKSSIWATLGIKNEKADSVGLFRSFQPKNNERNCIAETSKALQANPAALSRSVSFQESS